MLEGFKQIDRKFRLFVLQTFPGDIYYTCKYYYCNYMFTTAFVIISFSKYNNNTTLCKGKSFASFPLTLYYHGRNVHY